MLNVALCMSAMIVLCADQLWECSQLNTRPLRPADHNGW